MSRSFSDSSYDLRSAGLSAADSFGGLLGTAREAGRLPQFMRTALAACKLVIFMDIDQCAIIGEDTNDLLRVLFQLFADIKSDEEKKARLLELAMLLVNRSMLQALESIRARESDVRVVFYTQKASLVSLIRRYEGWVPALDEREDTLLFEAGSADQSYDYLANQCSAPPLTDAVHRGLDRLGLVTWASAKMLGLKYLPAVLVTESSKDVVRMATQLGFDPAKAYLFDDKAEAHIKSVGATPFAQEHVIPVQAFNFTTVGEEQAKSIFELLQTHFSVKGIKEADPKLYGQIQGDPTWPLQSRVISPDEDWVVRYPGGQEAQPWTIDRILAMFEPKEDNGRTLTV